MSHLISITGLGHLIGVKNSVILNSVGTLRVGSGKESFGFKKLLELVWTLVYVFQQSMKQSFTPLQILQSQNR